MKTFAALIRRYVLATAAIVLLVGGLLVGQIFYVGFKSNAVDATGYRVGALADALKQTETGLQWGREHTPAEWMQGYAWAMVLDDNGNVIWQQDLPQKLNHRYTASEVAVFSHCGTWPITPCSAGRRITGCLLWRNRLEPAGSITST